MRLATAIVGLALAGLGASHDALVFDIDGDNGEYFLANSSHTPTIWTDPDDAKAVRRAADDLAVDFGRVTGRNGTRVSNLGGFQGGPLIIAGTIGGSRIIDRLIAEKKLDVSGIEGGWENYITGLVSSPAPGISKALIVAGTDRRGVIWGIYDISEAIGVSPWYWWTDVPAETKDSIWVTNKSQIRHDPSIKWRGIFINNESPSLTTWAKDRFEKSDYGSFLTDGFYARVFELMLRLKANYIWPAMWGKAFYLDTKNYGFIAEDYGVVMGTSHHEPMARAEKEQQLFMDGIWDWDTNQEEVSKFMREGVRRASNKETLYTVGMRGSGDAGNPNLNPETLEEIIKYQQQLLTEELNVTDLYDVPQAWALYTEVGKYWQGGMEVADSVTLLWADDNYGNIMRTPLANETDRKAGHGVYYHFDFNGGFRSYKWINTIQMIKTWEQMHLAYEKGARELWITNVGDIKPLEIPITHFLDMAYDFSKHSTPESVEAWLTQWAAKTFNSKIAETTADILTTYGTLISRRKYEMLFNSPITPWSTTEYNEAELILQEWNRLLEKTQSVYDSLPPSIQLPFFEMVLHPVLAGTTVIDIFVKYVFNQQYAYEKRVSANCAAKSVHDLWSKDQQITDRYHGLLGGRWNGFVIQPHIGYTTWSDPPKNNFPNLTYPSTTPSGSVLGVSFQGNRTCTPGQSCSSGLLPLDSYTPSTYPHWVEVFARKNETFDYSITSSASFVKFSKQKGRIEPGCGKSQVRSTISVDWAAAPSGRTDVSLKVSRTGSSGDSVSANLTLYKRSVPSGFKGFVESGGVVSMEVDHYSNVETKNGLSYRVLPSYGRTRAGLKLWPVTADAQTPSTGPKVSYPFYTFTSTQEASLIIHLGSTLNHDPSRPLKYAFSIDGSTPETVQPIASYPMGSKPSGYTVGTMQGGYVAKSTVQIPAGAHELDLWLLEPGVVIQKLVIDVGGLRTSSQGPPESVRV